MQVLQPMHLLLYLKSSCRFVNPSGFWHQRQLNGQPLKKIVVLIPGPSCKENLCILKIRPFSLNVRFTPLELLYHRKAAFEELDIDILLLYNNIIYY